MGNDVPYPVSDRGEDDSVWGGGSQEEPGGLRTISHSCCGIEGIDIEDIRVARSPTNDENGGQDKNLQGTKFIYARATFKGATMHQRSICISPDANQQHRVVRSIGVLERRGFQHATTNRNQDFTAILSLTWINVVEARMVSHGELLAKIQLGIRSSS